VFWGIRNTIDCILKGMLSDVKCKNTGVDCHPQKFKNKRKKNEGREFWS
jgi:hypothetical protein